MPLYLLVLLPFAGSIVAALLPQTARKLEAWLAGLVALCCAAGVLVHYPDIAQGHVIQSTTYWPPAWA